MATVISNCTKRKEMNQNTIKQVRSNHHRVGHHHQQHKHHYRESEISLISNEDLASRLIEGYLPTIVIDTRDADIKGGQISGALFCPERSFGRDQVTCLIQKANERRRICSKGISNHKCYVVFYSRDSLKTSLRCAHRFHQVVREMGECSGICVKVLRGGADSWLRSYSHDHRLVQDFDDNLLIRRCQRSSSQLQDATSNKNSVPTARE